MDFDYFTLQNRLIRVSEILKGIQRSENYFLEPIIYGINISQQRKVALLNQYIIQK
jgi:hypothetical protein